MAAERLCSVTCRSHKVQRSKPMMLLALLLCWHVTHVTQEEGTEGPQACRQAGPCPSAK